MLFIVIYCRSVIFVLLQGYYNVQTTCMYITTTWKMQRLKLKSHFERWGSGCKLAGRAVDGSAWLAVAAPAQPIGGDEGMDIEHHILNVSGMMFQVPTVFAKSMWATTTAQLTHVLHTLMCAQWKLSLRGVFFLFLLRLILCLAYFCLESSAALQQLSRLQSQCACTSHPFSNTHGLLKLFIHSNQEACEPWWA